MHFTATQHIPPTSSTLKNDSFNGKLAVKLQNFTADLYAPPTYPLNPINPDNARILRITAAAGTELADPYSRYTCNTSHVTHFTLPKKQFTIHKTVFLHATWLVQAIAH
jgi:hypothetical protein